MAHLGFTGAAREQVTAVYVGTDEVAQHWGERVGRFMPGETLIEYRLRSIKPYQKYSPSWKDFDLTTIGEKALGIAEAQIRTDAIAAAKAPSVIGSGGLRKALGNA